MKTKRFFFYFPTRREESGVQTSPLSTDNAEMRDIDTEANQNAIEAILTRKMTTSSALELAVKSGYSRILGFTCSVFKDPRFNFLTPPSDLYEDFPVSYVLDFYESCFSISNQEKTSTKIIEYVQESFYLLECIENGFVSEDLFNLFIKIGPPRWEDGTIIIKITDHRFPEPFTMLLPLTIRGDVARQFAAEKTENEKERLLIESQAAITMHPTLCLDTSIDVARTQSKFDCRQKSWMPRNNRTSKDFEMPPPAPPKRPAPQKITPHLISQPIKIPASILSLFGK